jgi:hypothetical protein
VDVANPTPILARKAEEGSSALIISRIARDRMELTASRALRRWRIHAAQIRNG